MSQDKHAIRADASCRLGVLAASGGLDSTSLLLRMLAAGQEVFALSFDYGQRHRIELDRLQSNIEMLRGRGHSIHWECLDMSGLANILRSALTSTTVAMPLGYYEQDSMKATVVPNRNAIFASILFGHALSIATQRDDSVSLSLGVHAGDHAIYPDCRPDFYQLLWQAFQVGNWDSDRVRLELPYLYFDKSQILADAVNSCRELAIDFNEVFRNTCTSYAPDAAGRSHGLTGSDVERILAFNKLGRVDPIEYGQTWEIVLQQAQEAAKRHFHSNKERR